MAKTSFTVHLDIETAEKLEQMKEENPDFSRNALIRLAVKEFRLSKDSENASVDGVKLTEMHEEKYDWYMVRMMKMKINSLHKQINPDWKRKKSLPYHFPEEYHCVKNYSEFHGDGK